MKRFEMFLVAEGLLSVNDAVKAMDRQREMATPIGKIALAQRMLSVRQVFEILSEQATARTTKFGELAVLMGFMTREQVDALLAIQRDTRPAIADIVVDMGLLGRDAVEQALDKFNRVDGRQDG